MPVILACRRREMRRNGDELRTFEREDAVELRKPDVVANGGTAPPISRVHDDGLVAGFLRFGLAIHDPADLDVEQVDLAVSRDDLAVRVEHEARVRALLAALAKLDDRAADEGDP